MNVFLVLYHNVKYETPPRQVFLQSLSFHVNISLICSSQDMVCMPSFLFHFLRWTWFVMWLRPPENRPVYTAPATAGQHLYKSTQRQPFCTFRCSPWWLEVVGSFFSYEYNRHGRKKGSLIYFCKEPRTLFSMKKHHRENTAVLWRSHFSSKFFVLTAR